VFAWGPGVWGRTLLAGPEDCQSYNQHNGNQNKQFDKHQWILLMKQLPDQSMARLNSVVK
jgi:hypothetical protein